MEKRLLEDFLGRILRGKESAEETEENKYVRDLLKSIANDIGNSTSEYIKKENVKEVTERVGKSKFSDTEKIEDSVIKYNLERIINDAKRNELLSKYISKDDPYELGLDLAEKLYLNTVDRILFNDIILKDVNNLLKAIEEHGDETIEVLDIENIYLEYLLNDKESDDLSELDRTVLDAYRKIYSNTKSTKLERERRPIVEGYKEIDETFDETANKQESSEELSNLYRECMKIQLKIKTHLFKANKDDCVVVLDVLKNIPLIDRCYINTLLATELKLRETYYNTLDDDAKKYYLEAYKEMEVEVSDEE